MLMSTQRHIDDAIVEAKRAAKDYAVQFVALEIDGVEYRYVIDGNHSLAAAVADGVEPEFVDVTDQYAGEIAHLGALRWLESHHGGDDAYDPLTGICIW